MLGHRTDIASNGVEAIKAVQTVPYDLVLMDVNMQVMGGVEATQEIRRMQGKKGRIPIIALTANAIKGDRERFLAAGMNDYVSKPLDRDKLIAAVNAWGGRAPEEAPEPLSQTEASAVAGQILDPKVLDDWEEFLPAEQFMEVINTQIQGARDCLENLKAAVESGALDEIGELAHNLKSTGGSLGMSHVQIIAADLEAACGDGRKMEALELVPGVEDAVSAAMDALDERYGLQLSA